MSILSGDEITVASKVLYGKLLAAGLAVYPGIASREAEMPYVTYQPFPRPGGGDKNTIEGTLVLARLRFLLKATAPTQAEAAPIARAAHLAIAGQEGMQDGYFVFGIVRVEPYAQPIQEGDDLYWQVGGYYDVEVSGT